MITSNSVWSTGDWSTDGDFNSSDLVLAFQDGGYEQGPRAGVQAVPEPASSVLWLLSLLSVVIPSEVGTLARSGIMGSSDIGWDRCVLTPLACNAFQPIHFPATVSFKAFRAAQSSLRQRNAKLFAGHHPQVGLMDQRRRLQRIGW
ncbi:MAG: hypothetical protein R3C28_31720 [Pirellulaceae bacterium]